VLLASGLGGVLIWNDGKIDKLRHLGGPLLNLPLSSFIILYQILSLSFQPTFSHLSKEGRCAVGPLVAYGYGIDSSWPDTTSLSEPLLLFDQSLTLEPLCHQGTPFDPLLRLRLIF
jgi:hypothetical protein